MYASHSSGELASMPHMMASMPIHTKEVILMQGYIGKCARHGPGDWQAHHTWS